MLFHEFKNRNGFSISTACLQPAAGSHCLARRAAQWFGKGVVCPDLGQAQNFQYCLWL